MVAGGCAVTVRPLVALRGATTVDADEAAQVTERTQELLTELFRRNQVSHDELVSILFTCTEDITSEFPAVGARGIGLGDVPLMCMRELGIRHGNPLTIRVMVHCYSDVPRPDLRHVYLHDARHLRDDLPG
jgi:chorismate mutase